MADNNLADTGSPVTGPCRVRITVDLHLTPHGALTEAHLAAVALLAVQDGRGHEEILRRLDGSPVAAVERAHWRVSVREEVDAARGIHSERDLAGKFPALPVVVEDDPVEVIDIPEADRLRLLHLIYSPKSGQKRRVLRQSFDDDDDENEVLVVEYVDTVTSRLPTRCAVVLRTATAFQVWDYSTPEAAVASYEAEVRELARHGLTFDHTDVVDDPSPRTE